MEPGRNFHPRVSSLEVQAVHNRREIAIRVTWHDMRAERTGHNGPALVVPIEEEAASAPAPAAGAEEDIWGGAAEAAPAAAAEGGGDFWGEAEPAAATGPASEFSDAVALQLPKDPPTGIRKPYFLFGDAGAAVDLWFVDLAHARVQQFVGRGSASLEPVLADEIETAASYEHGEWSVVFKRSMKGEGGVSFEQGQYRADRVLGVGWWQSRAWQQARALAVAVRLRRAGRTGVGDRADAARGTRCAGAGVVARRARATQARGGSPSVGRRRLGSQREATCTRSIYVPVDNSDYSNQAVARAVEIGRAFESRMVGSHVYAARMHDYRFKQMEYTLPEEYLEENELERQRKIHDSLITMGLELISDCYLEHMDRQCKEQGLAFEPRTMDGKHHVEILKDLEQVRLRSRRARRARRRSRARQPDRLGVRAGRAPRAAGTSGCPAPSRGSARRYERDTILVGIDGSPQSFGALVTASSWPSASARRSRRSRSTTRTCTTPCSTAWSAC